MMTWLKHVSQGHVEHADQGVREQSWNERVAGMPGSTIVEKARCRIREGVRMLAGRDQGCNARAAVGRLHVHL